MDNVVTQVAPHAEDPEVTRGTNTLDCAYTLKAGQLRRSERRGIPASASCAGRRSLLSRTLSCAFAEVSRGDSLKLKRYRSALSITRSRAKIRRGLSSRSARAEPRCETRAGRIKLLRSARCARPLASHRAGHTSPSRTWPASRRAPPPDNLPSGTVAETVFPA